MIPIEDAKPGDVAFWKSSDFPYLLSGPITLIKNIERKDQRMVETSNFGRGYWFNPVIIMKPKDAAKLKDELDDLENKHNDAKLFVHTEYRRQLTELKEEWGIR